MLFWALEGEQPELEAAFKVTTPGIASFNIDKMNYYTGSGDFTEKSVSDFLNGIQKNKFFFAKLDAFPTLREV